MKTPICDFVRDYGEKEPMRLHMPGHKGKGSIEARDITEIERADSLYEADGIISESERYAGELFGAQTLYSTEGSSLCIRAMLYLAVLYARTQGKKPVVLTGRNAHRTFISAAALLDFKISWLPPDESYLSCTPSARELEKTLDGMKEKPTAVYLTSPDYLGRIADVKGIAEVCHRHGVLLLVDNAHGAYLKFLPKSHHPVDLGADACCDSAHKTLRALTGAAYLHISHNAPPLLAENAKDALSLFGSTSPSYLILQSLDGVNADIADGYRDRLAHTVKMIDGVKRRLSSHGYVLYGDEPMKITLCPKSYGYTGRELADILLDRHIVCEFSDPDFTVMMPSVETEDDELCRLADELCSVPRREAITECAPRMSLCEYVMSPREAMLSPSETVAVRNAVGRVLARASVGCPPAVPIVVCGERIDEDAVKAFRYYGIERCTVVKG